MSDPTGQRVAIDLSALPEVSFGRRSLSWWASVGFMAVEGTTLAVLLTSYLYLRTNTSEWPPSPVAPPELLVPTLNLLVLLIAILPAHKLRQCAQARDKQGVLRWFLVLLGFSVVASILRGFEFQSLNVDWNVNAYGSALWGVYVAHTLLLVADLLETAVMSFFFATGRNTPRHYSDAEDGAEYQYFLSAMWLLCYLVVILGPRIM